MPRPDLSVVLHLPPTAPQAPFHPRSAIAPVSDRPGIEFPGRAAPIHLVGLEHLPAERGAGSRQRRPGLKVGAKDGAVVVDNRTLICVIDPVRPTGGRISMFAGGCKHVGMSVTEGGSRHRRSTGTAGSVIGGWEHVSPASRCKRDEKRRISTSLLPMVQGVISMA